MTELSGPDGSSLLQLDRQWLEGRGLARSDAEAIEYLLGSTREVLEWVVGLRLSRRLTAEQLAEFDELINVEDPGEALVWLEGNLPDYRLEVEEAFRILDGLVEKAVRLASLGHTF